jgi:hypothetical protein
LSELLALTGVPGETLFKCAGMQLKEVVVEVVDIQRIPLTRYARTGWKNLRPDALKSLAVLREVFFLNAESHVLIAALNRRHALHGRDPDPAKDKELLARKGEVLAVAVINLDSP